MTTFQGLPGDRNSSRILRPPGGGDSNIFGTDPVPPPPCSTRSGQQSQLSNIFGDPPQTQCPPKPKEDTAKNIFGVSSNEEEQAKEAEPAQEKKKDEKDETANNNQDSHSATQSARAYARRMRGTYNPITGEGYDDTQAAAGTRVRQPPGGYSSKLW